MYSLTISTCSSPSIQSVLQVLQSTPKAFIHNLPRQKQNQIFKVDRSKIMLRYTLNIEASNGCIINRESRNTTGLVVCLWLIVPRSCWGTHQSQSLQHAAMDAPSTENQGIQPDPLYACGWSFQDRVEVHTKAKQAFSTLPWWIHYQQRIREFNRTRCTRVVDHSKIVLRYTPKPNKPLASCHGCTRCLEKRQWNLSETANCELKCVTLC